MSGTETALDLKVVGERLALFREKRGMSQKDVAESIGVSRGLYSYWESGERCIGLKDLICVCKCINVPPAILLLDDSDVLTRKDSTVFSWKSYSMF